MGYNKAQGLPLRSRPERLRTTGTAQNAKSRPSICAPHYCQASRNDVSAVNSVNYGPLRLLSLFHEQ